MSSSSSSSPEVACAEEQQELFSYKHATHDEILEELESRFLLNLPDEELASLDRICFQIEQAHWFYEDFVREQNSKFPSYPLKKFSAMMFSYSELLRRWGDDHERIFSTFMQYKTRVPVCGAIMLNDTWDKCVLVKGWKSSSGWGFPKGKINEDEPQTTCAVREVLEETGYNLTGKIDPDNVIEMSIRDQKIALYVVPGVPEDFPFKTKTRKEISKIEWFKLADLPTWKRNKGVPGKFYLIAPFIVPLKAFIHDRKPRDTPRKASRSNKAVKTNNRKDQSPMTTFPDANQESSSQSSADPQTPSPQYTQQQVTVVHDATTTVDHQTMDPHFARLLSSLTLSNAIKSDSVNKPSPSERSATPAPDTSPSSQTNLKNQVISPLPAETQNSVAAPQSPGNAVGNGPLISKPTHSPRVSRRISSTADISPYLPSTTEVPVSTRRLKQLALLEAVADESARMTPVLRNVLSNDRLSSFNHHRNDSAALLYSSVPQPFSSGAPQLLHDPFQVRSRTSHAVHRPIFPTHGSMSMSQSQLLSMINPPQQPMHPSMHGHPALPPPGIFQPPMQPQPPQTMPYRTGPLPPMPPPMPFQPAPPMSAGFLNPTDNTLLSILNGGGRVGAT